MKLAFALAIFVFTAPALAAGGEAGANPFAGTIYQALAAAIVFLTLLFVLKTKAWGPIIKGLQDRENKIKQDLEEAERANLDAKENLKAYQQQLNEAQAEAKRIIDQGRLDLSKIRAQETEKTQAEITAMRQQAQREIQIAKEQAVKSLIDEVGTLSTQIASQILKRQINPADQQQLVRDSIEKYSAAKN